MSVHGRIARYDLGCRCIACRECHRAYHRAWRARVRAEVVAGTRNVTHGQDGTYNNYACRCEPCRAAHSVVMARRNRTKQPT